MTIQNNSLGSKPCSLFRTFIRFSIIFTLFQSACFIEAKTKTKNKYKKEEDLEKKEEQEEREEKDRLKRIMDIREQFIKGHVSEDEKKRKMGYEERRRQKALERERKIAGNDAWNDAENDSGNDKKRDIDKKSSERDLAYLSTAKIHEYSELDKDVFSFAIDANTCLNLGLYCGGEHNKSFCLINQLRNIVEQTYMLRAEILRSTSNPSYDRGIIMDKIKTIKLISERHRLRDRMDILVSRYRNIERPILQLFSEEQELFSSSFRRSMESSNFGYLEGDAEQEGVTRYSTGYVMSLVALLCSFAVGSATIHNGVGGYITKKIGGLNYIRALFASTTVISAVIGEYIRRTPRPAALKQVIDILAKMKKFKAILEDVNKELTEDPDLNSLFDEELRGIRKFFEFSDLVDSDNTNEKKSSREYLKIFIERLDKLDLSSLEVADCENPVEVLKVSELLEKALDATREPLSSYARVQLPFYATEINRESNRVQNVPGFSLPEFSLPGAANRFKLTDLWDPAIVKAVSAIVNNIEFNDFVSGIGVTGANGSGKSYIVKAVALALLLSQSIAIIPCKEGIVPIVGGIYTCLGTIDDPSSGKSLFVAQVDRIAEVLAACERVLNSGRIFFSVYDEPANGTKPETAGPLMKGIIANLINKNDDPSGKPNKTFTMWAGHLMKLQELEKEHPGKVKYCHLEIVTDERGRVSNSYLLADGHAGLEHDTAYAIFYDKGLGHIVEYAKRDVKKYGRGR